MIGYLLFLLGALFGANLIHLLSDIEYLMRGRVDYFEHYMETFKHPYETVFWHILIAVIIAIVIYRYKNLV